MRILKSKRDFKNSFWRYFSGGLFLMAAILFFTSCAKTVNVYHAPRFDLTQFGRLGIVTFSDNARPSVAEYVTEQFQNKIHSSQIGIPIVELGTDEAVLKRIGSSRLDSEAINKIGQRYDVLAVFKGRIVYSDVKTHVTLNDITEFKTSVDTTLNVDRGRMSDLQFIHSSI